MDTTPTPESAPPGDTESPSGPSHAGEISRTAGITRNSLTLAISGAITAALGLGFWIAMGRLYPATEVGAAAAVITTATMLSAFGNLGLGAYLERFLPVAGARASLQVGIAIGVTALCGLLLGTGFLFVGPTDEMFSSTFEMVFFPLAVVALSTFAIFDHVSIGLQRANWAARKNIIHAVAKLVVSVVLAASMGRMGIIAPWICIALVGSVAIWLAVRRDLTARRRDSRWVTDLPPTSELRRFVIGNYGIYVAGSLTPLILPLLVVSTVGASHNAYFAIVWSLISAVMVLMIMLMGPYVAAASAGEDDLRRLTLRFAAIMGAVSVAAAIGFVTVGPVVLQLTGEEYAANGTPLLRLAALAIPLAGVGMVYTAVCRVRRRLLPALAVQVVAVIIMLSLTTMWLDEHGLVAAGVAMLITESVVAALVIIPLLRFIRAAGRANPTDIPSAAATASP